MSNHLTALSNHPAREFATAQYPYVARERKLLENCFQAYSYPQTAPTPQFVVFPKPSAAQIATAQGIAEAAGSSFTSGGQNKACSLKLPQREADRQALMELLNTATPLRGLRMYLAVSDVASL